MAIHNDSINNKDFIAQDGSYQEKVLDYLAQTAVATEGTDFFLQVERGLVANLEGFNIFGYNGEIDAASAPEDLWSGGGLYNGFPAVAETLEILSTSINDTSGGTGARQVTITNLLDENYNEVADITVTLNGTTPVSLGAGLFLRCSRAYIIDAGSTGSNAGVITVRHTTTTSNVFTHIPIGFNQSQTFSYTVPAGKTLHISDFRITMGLDNGATNISATMSVDVRSFGTNTFRRVRHFILHPNAGGYFFDGNSFFTFAEKTDIRVRIHSVTDNDTIVNAEATGVLITTV